MKISLSPTLTSLILFAVVLLSIILLWDFQSNDVNQVNVYSTRKPQLIQPMFDEFTATTKIDVNVVFAEKGMLEKLRSEGANSPADLVFTADIGRLADVKNAGLTQVVQSTALARDIPASMRDEENHWYGLTSRARIIVTSKERIGEEQITTYEDLGNPQFNGRVCTRSGKHAYMVALTAAMIAHHGLSDAEQWLTRLKSNLARRPEGNDRAQVKAIKQGVCDIAVINHYYIYKMLNDAEQKPWADAVNIIFPNQSDRGTHMNISGMAMTKHAPNRDNALKLMEFLASEKIQQMYTRLNGEYAVKQGIPLADSVKAWGDFKRDPINLTEVASYRRAASKMADRVAYDD